ncbi:UDP-N-acetylmuramoylalanyl-D-glutamate--2,6-diaminopimelate ligase [Halospina denitrificans]|uniref:UDP-N-acetylmuramoyl-L-alanyl-D-glutamate--2,6-diaminopimelate ligase n=1 Tax=Halospina denitrificans TaxID=332522 RepID=A0A4R7JJW9_9GAMM|nr:UDP-N-acetylmuramoyl-L-alanyl-D-glutamate--2,6-diaminopimelate ligase [Halospina denitrificans]TDT37884.1 UDP-N-acetylmuramoylalanyl-D-glutamate--2,6-diaminopimelate ligase [Halospina denitrificans]
MTSVCHSLKGLLRDLVDVPSVLDTWLYGLTADSRRVRPGMAFLALAGETAGSWTHVPDAVARGASAVLLDSDRTEQAYEYGNSVVVPVQSLRTRAAELADHFYDHPSSRLSVVGVTGTNGKSSVTTFLAQLLNRCGVPAATIGTLGYGFAPTLEEASHTTPDVVRVHELLGRFCSEGARAVVMEVSSHALDQGRVNRVRFAGGIFTNLSSEHLDYHGTMEHYGNAKAQLFEIFEPEFAVINVDDAFGVELSERLSADVRLLRYGMTARSPELFIHEPNAGSNGMEATVDTPLGKLELNTRLMGAFNISNMTAAAGAALAMGIPVADIQAAAPTVTAPPGRLEAYRAPSGLRVVIDYAHTEHALETALTALRPHAEEAVWCVFGCGGNRDTAKRPAMGGVAERLADRVVVTDDNPRDEAPAAIVEQILAGMNRPDEVRVIHDRLEAITTVIAEAGGQDLILIAGKGHERVQERAGERIPFSDVDVVRELLGYEGDAA